MKTLKSILVIGIILVASIMAPVNAQWVEVFSPGLGFNNFYMLDSLNGWFTHLGVDKIYHTSDGGNNFNVQLTVALPFNMYDVYMEDTQNGWACGSNTGSGPGYIYRTSNGGANWIQMNHPASQSIWGQIIKVGSSIWIVGSYNGSFEYLLILKTSNGGTTWDLSEFPQHIGGGIHAFNSLNFIVYGVNGTLDRTTDGGNSWISANLPSDYQVEKVKFLDDNLGYALVSNIWSNPADAYLYRTADGGFTWNLYYSWVDKGQKSGLSVIPATGTVFVGGALNSSTPYLYGILKSNDGGLTWDTISTQGYGANYIYTPNIYNGWATDGLSIYRYSYVSPPTIEPISNKLIQFGQPFQYQVQASGLGLKYTMSGQPSGLNIGLYSGLISGTPSQVGNFPITVTVKDTDANVVNTQFSLRVNRQPLFIPPWPPTHAWVDSLYQSVLTAIDNDNDTLTFSALQKPDFLELISNPPPNTALLQGTPAITDTGFHNISIMADDGYGGADTLNFILQVTEYLQLVVLPITDQLIQFGQQFSYQVQASGLGLRYFLSGQPAGVSIGLYSGLISGLPQQGGVFNIIVSVQDTVNNTASTDFGLRVNRKPVFTPPFPSEIALVDSLYQGLISASDEDGDSLSFTVLLKPDFLELIINPPSPGYTATLQGVPSASDTGSHNISVLLNDGYGGEDTLSYILIVDIVTGIKPEEVLPTEFILFQNYPNPFNPTTKIKFTIPQADSPLLGWARGGLVTLKVYDLLGNEITILVNEEKQPGVYEAIFDASALTSGVYFYQLKAGEYAQTKKLILLK